MEAYLKPFLIYYYFLLFHRPKSLFVTTWLEVNPTDYCVRPSVRPYTRYNNSKTPIAPRSIRSNPDLLCRIEQNRIEKQKEVFFVDSYIPVFFFRQNSNLMSSFLVSISKS